MSFTGNGITSCYLDEVENFISITVLTAGLDGVHPPLMGLLRMGGRRTAVPCTLRQDPVQENLRRTSASGIPRRRKLFCLYSTAKGMHVDHIDSNEQNARILQHRPDRGGGGGARPARCPAGERTGPRCRAGNGGGRRRRRGVGGSRCCSRGARILYDHGVGRDVRHRRDPGRRLHADGDPGGIRTAHVPRHRGRRAAGPSRPAPPGGGVRRTGRGHRDSKRAGTGRRDRHRQPPGPERHGRTGVHRRDRQLGHGSTRLPADQRRGRDDAGRRRGAEPGRAVELLDARLHAVADHRAARRDLARSGQHGHAAAEHLQPRPGGGPARTVVGPQRTGRGGRHRQRHHEAGDADGDHAVERPSCRTDASTRIRRRWE